MQEPVKLVTCPTCGGTGSVKNESTLTNKTPDRLDSLSKLLGAKQTSEKLPYKTCPQCRGFCQVRENQQ